MECEIENGFKKRRVCIICAGMSGPVATTYLLNMNMDLIVFELKQGVGGLWS
jgi:cation diffusion facilitator CzcD-associated flavoprotein CzcO